MTNRSRDRVLVVDDDDDVREMLVLAIESTNRPVSGAKNGLDALEQVSIEMPAVILLDMRMPVMDGWAFAREFRKRHDRLAAILVLTAATDAGARAREVDADGYLGKPFEIDELLDMIDRLASAPRGA